MRFRLLAFLPIAALVSVACSSASAAPTWTFAPSAVAVSPESVPASTPEPILPTTEPTAVPAATAGPAMDHSAHHASPSSSVAAVTESGTIEVVMTDAMRFEPGEISVPAGKPVTFVVRNAGLIVHELFVGDEAEQEAHADEMAENPGGTHAHGNAVRVPAAGSESLTMTFDKPGRVLLGCHEPGHYVAGMVGTLEATE